MFRFIFSVAILGCFVTPVAQTCADYRTTLRHIESGGIGYEDGYTTFEAFLASNPSQWITFLDARAHIFNNGKWAANFGAGWRSLCNNRVYGINTYYDFRNTDRFHSNQIGMGLESLGELFDFRINGYLPIGTKTSHSYDAVFSTFSGNYALLSEKYQSAMKGADAEFGFHFRKCESFDFYAAAGPYYIKGKRDPATWGGKARIVATYNDILSLEISDSYDRTFHNKLQGQISLSFSFGCRSKRSACNVVNTSMLQPVRRQEIIVIDHARKKSFAIDPNTGRPYFFVFVDNTSSSEGTYENPYHSFAQAEEGSSSNNIIYVFPGDGTTTGMDSGISLKANQKLWGSGISYLIQTTNGPISIPAQSTSAPNITNTNIDTEGNAITLATNNAISGIVITSAINDAIYGADPQNLEVSFCTIKDTQTFSIEALFSGEASISLTNNQFLNNVNGVFLNLSGPSTVLCVDNVFTGQTSVSSVPMEVVANSNTFAVHIENNVFDRNTTGSIRFNLNDVVDADINVVNNTITNNGSGAQASLGSSFVVLSNGTTDHCSLRLSGNRFLENASNALYLHTSGAFTALEATVSENTVSDCEGSALVFATPVDVFTLVAKDNTIVGCHDNGIAVISSGLTSLGNITISNNVITDIGNASNGIAINQDFSNLTLAILNNEISRCEGTGIISYAPTGIGSLTLNILGNTISNCENMSSNAAAGIDIEQYSSLLGSITNNTLSGNTGLGVVIGSTLPSPTACLTLTGNNNDSDYLLTNPVDGIFNLSPLDVDTVNTGVIQTSGDINYVESCPNPI